jgi:hypothetical protein
MAQWHTIYSHPESAFWWFIHYSWNVEDPPIPDGLWTHNERLVCPDGGEPWLVTFGVSCGSLSGFERAELWAWDGAAAKFVKEVGCCDF